MEAGGAVGSQAMRPEPSWFLDHPLNLVVPGWGLGRGCRVLGWIMCLARSQISHVHLGVAPPTAHGRSVAVSLWWETVSPGQAIRERRHSVVCPTAGPSPIPTPHGVLFPAPCTHAVNEDCGEPPIPATRTGTSDTANRPMKAITSCSVGLAAVCFLHF